VLKKRFFRLTSLTRVETIFTNFQKPPYKNQLEYYDGKTQLVPSTSMNGKIAAKQENLHGWSGLTTRQYKQYKGLKKSFILELASIL
jgi:hypothetical protein